MKNKKHKGLVDDYDIQKSKHLERLATKSLAVDENFVNYRIRKLRVTF